MKDYKFQVIKCICYFIYLFTGNERYLAASLLTFSNVQVTNNWKTYLNF